jgi:menaquinone-dependent protoporphyrinogen oxidase
MQVLVTAASKHGATQEMAMWIADTIRSTGIDTVLRAPTEVASLEGFDAVVLGSGVYAGHWLGDATTLVERLGPEFTTRAVWLFSSGPAGDPPQPDSDPVDAAPVMAATGAREHRIFGGRIARKSMGFAEWAVVAALRVRDGDYRPRAEVEAWAREIAVALGAPGGAVDPATLLAAG